MAVHLSQPEGTLREQHSWGEPSGRFSTNPDALAQRKDALSCNRWVRKVGSRYQRNKREHALLLWYKDRFLHYTDFSIFFGISYGFLHSFSTIKEGKKGCPIWKCLNGVSLPWKVGYLMESEWHFSAESASL